MKPGDKRVEAHPGMDHPLYTGPTAGSIVRDASSDVGREHPLGPAKSAADQGGTAGGAFGSGGTARVVSDQGGIARSVSDLGNTLALPDLISQPALDAAFDRWFSDLQLDYSDHRLPRCHMERAFSAGFRAGVQSCLSK